MRFFFALETNSKAFRSTPAIPSLSRARDEVPRKAKKLGEQFAFQTRKLSVAGPGELSEI